MKVNLIITIFILCSVSGLYAEPADSTKNAETVTAPADSLTDTLSIASADSADSAGTIEKVTLIVKTEPAGVSIFLNDSLMGLSPITVEGLDIGKHYLTLKKTGYYLKKAELNIDTAGVSELFFTLQQPGGLKISSTPVGAEVLIDGKPSGKTPLNSSQMKPGEYKVRAELPGYDPFENQVSVKSGVIETLQIDLKHSAAYLDSLENARIEAQRNRKRFSSILVMSAFTVFGVILFLMERTDR